MLKIWCGYCWSPKDAICGLCKTCKRFTDNLVRDPNMKNSALVDGVVISREQAEKALTEMNKVEPLQPGTLINWGGKQGVVVSDKLAALIGKSQWPHDWERRTIFVMLEDGRAVGNPTVDTKRWLGYEK